MEALKICFIGIILLDLERKTEKDLKKRTKLCEPSLSLSVAVPWSMDLLLELEV